MADPIPAATVILLRDHTGAGLEVLMLRKRSGIAFGGMWVFPGGRVDEADWLGVDEGDDQSAARRAAVREALEEADLIVDPDALVPFSHWTPPDSGMAPKRFATWFFATRAPHEGLVTIDGGEIHEEAWVEPAVMLARRTAGEVELAPPTIVTLHDLAAHDSVDAVLAAARNRVPERFFTRIAAVEGGAALLWAGDAGYETSDATVPGPRNRLWMTEPEWRYERSGC